MLKLCLKVVFSQTVDVMALVQAVCNVLIQQDNVLAMLVTKALIVMLLVVAIQQVQVAHHAMLLQVNALAILGTQEPHVIPVTPTTTKQVTVLLVQVSNQYHPVSKLKLFSI